MHFWTKIFGTKPLSEAMLLSLLTHICVTQPQLVKAKHNIALFWQHVNRIWNICCLFLLFTNIYHVNKIAIWLERLISQSHFKNFICLGKLICVPLLCKWLQKYKPNFRHLCVVAQYTIITKEITQYQHTTRLPRCSWTPFTSTVWQTLRHGKVITSTVRYEKQLLFHSLNQRRWSVCLDRSLRLARRYQYYHNRRVVNAFIHGITTKYLKETDIAYRPRIINFIP